MKAALTSLSLIWLTACVQESEVFDSALACVADGWNANDARVASECFTENAVYTEAGQKQLYEGRQALFEFFGGEQGRDSAMSMTWHNRAYDPETQTGLAEFSFEYGTFAHGVAIIKIENGKMSNWREYWYESDDKFQDFIAPRLINTQR